MRGCTALPLVLILGSLLACPPADTGPTPAEVAAAFGLVDGRALHYDVSNATVTSEDHSYRASSSYLERLVFTRTEQNQGWARMDDDGTPAVYDIEVTAQGLQLLARGDCVPRCGEYDPPVLLAEHPLTTGARHETTSTFTVSENGTTSTREERHVFIVGSQGSLDTPAGAQQAYEIGWQRFVDGGALESASLYLVPDLGLVGIDRFDGASLRLRQQDN
jgi:hypothetical protein